MPSKRKRDMEIFDPNKTDSDDGNFDPGADRAARSRKRSRPSQGAKRGRKGSARYRGSDIEDDGGILDSEEEQSYGEDGDDSHDEDKEEENAPVNASGRRARKAAVSHRNYKDPSDEEDEEEKDEDAEGEEEVGDSDEALEPTPRVNNRRRTKSVPDDDVEEAAEDPSAPRRRKLITLKMPVKMTRRRTEEVDESLVEFSTSGKHVNKVARSSETRSPEPVGRTRSSRAVKGLKKPPETVDEATQETENATLDQDADELAGDADDVEADAPEDADMGDAVKESTEGPVEGDDAAAAADDDDDDDDVPITRGRTTRASKMKAAADEDEQPQAGEEKSKTGRRLTRLRKSKSVQEPSSDFEPGEDSPDDANMSETSAKQPAGDFADLESPTPRGRGAKRNIRSAKSSGRRGESEEEVELDQDEMADELDELRADSRSRPRRKRRASPAIIYQETAKRRRAAARPMNYYMPPLSAVNIEEEEAAEDPAPTPARRRGGRGAATQVWDRPLNTTFGPFGGGGGAGSLLTGPWGTGAAGGVDSDSSDDEMGHRSGAGGGNPGTTPTSGAPSAGLLPGAAQSAGAEAAGVGATPNVGKIKNQKSLADADPLGVDLTVDFSKVGGLQGHIDQLKEMVQLPLLYPELFQRFHVTPPRGVLFHGPPGTGKTLLARALANAMGVGGRKITFYMRKGADALSKWVGEAEKQLRLLFEEARRTQPSIIFFDEIDGLAPVRSSKQEQIHASIVSTLLALMDGMDGRGQVIVIGATNRPDNIDPALRRPGRFDREFYFPLPDAEARRSILNIHTNDWGLSDSFKQNLAETTKGYGGADLRSLCTEAALNSIQRSYPQIYSSKDKLIVDPSTISIHATDFMLSIKKMIPSSERSAGAGAAPLPKGVEPLLRDQFCDIKTILDELLPRKKKITALEEAMYEQFEDNDHGFGRETLHQEFERSRIFRPRFLIQGLAGMGQSYLSSALLHHLEGVQVQNFGLPNLLADGRPMEQVIVSMFTEVKRHKPSVIYIPNIESWYESIRDSVAFVTFKAMLKSIAPTEPILVLATAEDEGEGISPEMRKEMFAFSRRNRFEIERPKGENRREYFASIVSNVRKSPSEFPDPANRKKRVLEELPVAPAPPPKVPTKEEVKNMQKRDHQLLNILKVQLQPIMDQINRKYRKFRQPVIAASQLEYLFLESDPNYIRPDVAEGEVRPFEIVKDKHGNDVLRETATGKTLYNLETTTIEERLSNGFYSRPDDFLRDIKTLAKDAKKVGDKERTLKANELVSNVEVDVASIASNTATIDWEALRMRQIQRAKVAAEKERKHKAMQSIVNRVQSDTAVGNDSDSQGPVVLGERIPGSHVATRFQPMSPPSNRHGAGLSLGSHPLCNGITKPPEGDDVHMGGVDDNIQPISVNNAMRPPSQWPRTDPRSADDSAKATTGTNPLSQRSAITTVPPGVSPSALANDASTTKTSDPSERSSSKWSTQVTNGYHSQQDTQNDSSQIPDTQITGGIPPSAGNSSSDDPWQHSQVDAPARGTGPGSDGPSPQSGTPTAFGKGHHVDSSPTSGRAAAANTLNTDGHSSSRNPGSSASQQQPVINEGQVEDFLQDLTERTSGCTIEQLEQINRELMDELWRTRDEWNRMKVLGGLSKVFNETISDLEQMQGLMQQSQDVPSA